jgi:hypothetical protein
MQGSTRPKDIASGIHIGVVEVLAPTTSKHCLVDAVSRFDVTTLCAHLAGMARIDSHNYPTGAFSLVGKQ